MINDYANYEWFLEKDLSEFSGEWVAIIDKKIVAHSKNVNEMIKKVKQKFPAKKPLVTKVKNKLSVL